jgi:hypothetical protein
MLLNIAKQRWNGYHFKTCDLYTLGLVVQLGHQQGGCLHPTPADVNFFVIHTNGIHRVRLNFCDCARSTPLPYDRQLLEVGWWPASLIRPKTCATLSVLKHFHIQTLQGKVPAFDFYRALELETDNTGLSYLPVCICPSIRYLRLAHII